MKITIDTKEDSTADIQRAIELLQRFVEQRGGSVSSSGMVGSTDLPSDESSNQGFVNMFGDMPVAQAAGQEPVDESSPAEEEKEPNPADIPDLEVY